MRVEEREAVNHRGRSNRSPRRAIGVAIATLALAGCGAFMTPKAHIERARREMAQGNWHDAAFDLRAVLNKQPRNTEAWLLLARLSVDAADLNGAQSALEHAVHAGAKGPTVDLLQARLWLETGQPHALLDAIAHHQVALPEPDRSLLNARALLATGQTDAAAALLRPLVASAPAATDARDLLAESLLQAGRLPEALAQLRIAIQRAPTAAEPRLIEGRVLAWQGQFAAAESALDQALARMPPAEPVAHRLTALVALTQARLALGEIDAAAKSQAMLAKLEPAAPMTQLLDARIKLVRGQIRPATDELERIVVNAPSFVEARMLLGAALLQRGDLQQAQQQLRRVVAQTPDNVQARKLLAQVQLKLGQPNEALSVLTPAIEGPSADPTLLSLFGSAASQAGNPAALVQALERSAKAHPNDPPVIENLASVYLATGHAREALALLQKIPDTGDLRRDQLWVAALAAVRGPNAALQAVDELLAKHPHDPRVANLAASLAVSQHHFGRARLLLRSALAENPGDGPTALALAKVDQAAGDPAAAQRRLGALLAAHPQALPVRLALADSLASTRAFANARTVLEAAKDAAKEPAVQFALARLALAQGDAKAARAAIDRAVAARPNDPAVTEDAGLVLMQANQPDAALARFAQATTLAPTDAGYWLNSARAQLALNQPAAARASLAKADQLQPNWLPVVSALALIDLRERQGAAALARSQALVAHDPNDPGALELQGDVEMAIGQTSAAGTAYAAAERLRPSAELAVKRFRVEINLHAAHPTAPLDAWLAREPNDWRVHDVLGNYLLATHRPAQALPHFKAAVAENPGDVVALNNLAWAMSEAHDPGAQPLALRAYALAPQSPAVNDTLGWILARSGEDAKALGYLERAATLNPKDPEVGYHYAYALAKTGQGAKARQILSRILASPAPFDSRQDAERLLGSIRG
ncbi:MAG: PEP-CTERM system TPR-repeat protein PrsT [Gammaproteobacteria bacterium]|nr:PEP-CTERM system TPR-repeat protein PrsT [Gammaproteobacteria bacterium]